MPITQWEKSEEKVEKVKALWAEGVTAQQGADILGVSRSAFLGIVHRLKNKKLLRGRISPGVSRQVPKRRKIWAPGTLTSAGVKQNVQHIGEVKKKSEWVDEIHVDDRARDVRELKALLDLQDADCRWPIGDPQSESFKFCARERVPGKPYCYAHVKRAYNLPDVKQEASETHIKPQTEPIMQMETA